MERYFRTSYLAVTLGILVLIYLYSLFGRMPDIDDAWIGEHAYWLATEGVVKSELMRGITLQEETLVVHHKLLTLHGALFIKAFGFSLYSLKSIALIYFLLFLVIFYAYTVRLKKLFDTRTWLLSMILLFTFPWIFKYSFLYRPEIPVMTLGFMVYILLDQYLEKDQDGWLDVFLAGIVAGLCFVFHMNGIIVPAAAVLLLWWNKKWKQGSIFGTGAFLASLLYWYDLREGYGLSFWWYQFSDSPALDSLADVPAWLQPLMNLAGEHQRYFHDPMVIVFSLLLFVSLGFSFKYLYKNNKNLLRFTILLMVLLGLMAMHKSRQYLLVMFPYFLILITLSLKRIYELRKRHMAVRYVMLLIMIAYLGVSTYYNLRLALEKFSTDMNREIVETYIDEDPSTLNIIAPMTFIFNEIEGFNRIQGEVCYTELQKAEPDIYGAGFLEKADDFEIDYILLTPYYQELLGMDKWGEDDDQSLYLFVHRDEDILVLKRKEGN